MDKQKYIFMTCFLAFVDIPVSTFATMSVYPDNLASIQGSNMTLFCTSSNSSLRWFHSDDPSCLSSASCTNSLIFSSTVNSSGMQKDFLGRYSIDTSNGGQNLIISGTQMQDAGHVACVDQSTTPVSYSVASLTVLQSVASCTGNYSYGESNMVNVTCAVNFQGDLAPVMDFLSGDGTALSGRTTNKTVFNSTASYSYLVPATRDMDGQNIICNTYFNPPPNKPNYSKTTPSYVSIVPCGTFSVTYCPVCSKQSYKVPAGQNIQCYSESYPPATYTWIDLTGGLPLTYASTRTGAMLSTGQLIFGSVYQCTVCSVCVPDVEVCCNQTYTVVKEDAVGTIVGGTFGGLFVLVAFIVFVILLIRHENNQVKIPHRPRRKSTYKAIDEKLDNRKKQQLSSHA